MPCGFTADFAAESAGRFFVCGLIAPASAKSPGLRKILPFPFPFSLLHIFYHWRAGAFSPCKKGSDAMPTPYFEVAHLTKHFSTDESTVAAIQDVSFSLQKGQFLSILGPSGCGKSTLFNLIAGLMQPDCGDIRLQGESMLLRPGLTGYMLQKDLLLPWRTIADNIILSKTLHGTAASSAEIRRQRHCCVRAARPAESPPRRMLRRTAAACGACADAADRQTASAA